MLRKHLNNRDFHSPIEHWRIYILVFFIILAAAVIFIRLYSLQVVAHNKYLSLAQNQHEIFQELVPERGEIFLKDGKSTYPLAVNQDLQMAYAVPREVEEPEKIALMIASILDIDEGLLKEKFSDENDLFEIIKHKLTDEEISKVKELDLPGIYMMPEKFRYYPAGGLAAHIVGFVGSDGEKYTGRYGIESYWEEELHGKAGSLNQERDTGGRWISITDRDLQPAQDGIDLVLTISYPIQYEVEKILRETVEKHGADDGTIIVMEPATGKILALANYPSFNPNNYSDVEDMSVFLNPAVSFTYECGSVFKPVTMAAGIDDGKIEPDSTYVDTGSVHEAGYTITNSEGKTYGQQTMTKVLEESINTGVIHVEKLIGNRKFADYVKRFGFGNRSGIELPAESAGNTKNLKELRKDIQFFTAAFGQGVAVTPIQLINSYAVIANGGKLMKPQIIDKIIHPDGTEEEIRPQEIRRVISEEAARKVREMLRSVVVNGHGKRADVPGYLVGGKTGTAQVAKVNEKGYEEGVTIGSFAGFAPTDDPQFAILVKIYNPKDVQWAESTAAPAFSKVMKFLLEYYKIKPTEEY
ncbi:stage V sporulation protein D [bacterium BMS3Abin15]|nr:stage V sporulation protein D [bacterium BMS3Abin15]HDZ85747.1 penicillin-binding protein 2 [Candidatus Moranbacteria bacterium]